MIHVQKFKVTNFFIVLVALLLDTVMSDTYFVIPDDYSLHHTHANTFTLQHYLNNTHKYFVSQNQFHFIQGQYNIENDIVVKDIDNFTIAGIDHCTIICTAPASLIVMNANTIKIMNIELINCINNHKDHFNISYFNTLYVDSIPFSENKDNFASVFLYNSSSVTICNMNINVTVNNNFTTILIVNIKGNSEIIDVKVQVNTFNCTAFSNHQLEINGLKILVYFYDKVSKSGSVIIDNFHYKQYKSCMNHLVCVIITLFLRNDRYNITNKFSLRIHNSIFNNLTNSSILCSYGETEETYDLVDNHRLLVMKNCTFSGNTGNPHLNMFHVALKRIPPYVYLYYQTKVQVYNYVLQFYQCTFTRNSNMKALIYIQPPSTKAVVAYIKFIKGTITGNKNVTFIKVQWQFHTIWYSTIRLQLRFINISSNKHHYGDNLILIANGHLQIQSVFLHQNGYYENIFDLQSSLLIFEKPYSEISSNYARHIIKAQSSSFIFMQYSATVNVSHNVVYKVIKQVNIFEKHATPICPLQVYAMVYVHSSYFSQNSSFLDVINCILMFSNNVEMISKTLPTDIISYVSNKCRWLEDTSFQNINANVSIAYHKIVTALNNTFASKTAKRLVPLSVCPCLNNDTYNCYMANVYAVFPGQTLHINLIVSPRWSGFSSTVLAANTKDDDCSILDSYQLSQTISNNGCNRYNYTIWPNSEFITECKLFIGLSEEPEMFYVQIKSCPMGFTLQSRRKACYCDPLLNNDKLSITSCDINDETILRPANSWISAVTVNNSHSYNVSSQCPFDCCLPYSSLLNLSNTDSQCQFKRSGVVCAECQQGLSTVFGSSRCKQRSNLYLLLIIPIAIAGVVLVMMLFTFNLTVTNGIINTLILYVNIISINYSQFCFDSNSPDCTLLSLLNLDLGIETCFYDGMDGYIEMWLQLVFPCYLMIIAFTLIIGSRYSSKLQRLIAKRVLKVLATLFLLSYAKTLLTVCQILFFFSSVTQLPGNHTTFFWSVDTGVELFGVKFYILYTVSLIVFIALLIFNIVLLFPRTASRWSFINYFKPLLDAYFGPYKQKYAFWTGLQLLIRTSFFGLSALSRNVSLFSGALLVGIVLCTHGIMHPYKSKYINLQESLVLLDLLAVYVTALYNEYDNGWLIIRLLIITVLGYFIVLIFCHCIMLMYGDVIMGRANKVKQMLLMKWIRRKQTHSESLQLEQLRSKIPDVTFNYNEFIEPLVALD